MGDKGDKNAARPPEGSLVETRCLIKGPKSAIVPFPGPRSGPKSRTGRVRLTKLDLCPVVGRSRLTVVANCTVCSGVFHHWIHHLWPKGAAPQALTLFGGVGFIARRLRRPEKGNADGVRGIFGTAYRVGLRPCDRTHLKKRPCAIFVRWWDVG